MHSILFSIFLASTLVSAIPTYLDDALGESNHRDIEKVKHTVAAVKTTFGSNMNHAKTNSPADERFRVQSMGPAAANTESRAGILLHDAAHQVVDNDVASLCSRSLYKRALLHDDPVGYYLSKRSQCNLPPGHLAKTAAAKGTTTVANKGTTSPARANGRANIAKPTGVKGTKESKGAATKANGEKTVRKGTFTRQATGAMAGKGLKTVKGTKAAKGVKTAKGAKPVKGLKTAKADKGLKAEKGAKASKGVKAVKTTKVGKAFKVTKGVTAVKGVKAVKGAKGAKGTASPKSVKVVKETRGPKSTATLKTTGVAKIATKVPTKAPSKKGKNLRRDLGISIDELE